jgi:hypothetical protein
MSQSGKAIRASTIYSQQKRDNPDSPIQQSTYSALAKKGAHQLPFAQMCSFLPRYIISSVINLRQEKQQPTITTTRHTHAIHPYSLCW